eukprot:Em0010g64a
MAVPTAEAPVIEPLNLFSTETVETLANGFLAVLEPDLQHVQKNIDDLIASQEDMLQSVNEKKAYFQDQKEAADIAATIQLVPHYKNKLSSIIKQMQGINKRVTKLKQRALHLKELRTMKDEQSRKDYERQLNQVYQLAAKPPK